MGLEMDLYASKGAFENRRGFIYVEKRANVIGEGFL